MSFSAEDAGRLYRIPLTDYGRGRGVLISSGCGIMMAVMDQIPFRWCLDTDRLDRAGLHRLADFAEMASASGPVGVCGWFSISDPEPLSEALRRVKGEVLGYAGNKRFGVVGESSSLSAFLERCALFVRG